MPDRDGKKRRLDTTANAEDSQSAQVQVARSHHEYTIAWFCSLPMEVKMARAMLDQVHPDLPQRHNDDNMYILGSMCGHNVVIARSPADPYGLTPASILLRSMQKTFPLIEATLFVGIGGGVPNTDNDIRLGDVVISTSSSRSSAVVRYDHSRTTQAEFEVEDVIKDSPRRFNSAIEAMRSDQAHNGDMVQAHIEQTLMLSASLREQFEYPGQAQDILKEPQCGHLQCQCGEPREIVRKPRPSNTPVMHFGTIASGDQVIKDARLRDTIATQTNALCFRMELPRVFNYPHSLVICGICDYCDSNKQKPFQLYAALTAAATAKVLLSKIPMHDQTFAEPLEAQDSLVGVSKTIYERVMSALNFGEASSWRPTIRSAHPGTCQWFLQCSDFVDWLEGDMSSGNHRLLWIKGRPGTGKSTLVKFVLEQLERRAESEIVVSFFFNARGTIKQKSAFGMYRSLIFQLLKKKPESLRYLDNEFVANTYEPTIGMLKQSLEAIVRGLKTQHLIFVIDALDECSETDVRDMVMFFEELIELSLSSSHKLSILWSSRYYLNISSKFGVTVILDDQSGHIADVKKYIETELNIGDPVLAKIIKADVLDKSSGSFLWVTLVMNILQREYDHGRVWDIRRCLQEIPLELEDFFKDVLTRDTKSLEELVLCLQWILYSLRPLYKEEVYFALSASVVPSELVARNTQIIDESTIARLLLDTSKGLLKTYPGRNQPVEFIHETVREFLLEPRRMTGIPLPYEGLTAGPSHCILRRGCEEQLRVASGYLKYTAIQDVDEDWTTHPPKRWEILSVFPFLDYAVNYVLLHAEQAQVSGHDQLQFLLEFDFQQWRLLHNVVQQYKKNLISLECSFNDTLVKHDLRNLLACWQRRSIVVSAEQALNNAPSIDADGSVFTDNQTISRVDVAGSQTDQEAQDDARAGTDSFRDSAYFSDERRQNKLENNDAKSDYSAWTVPIPKNVEVMNQDTFVANLMESVASMFDNEYPIDRTEDLINTALTDFALRLGQEAGHQGESRANTKRQRDAMLFIIHCKSGIAARFEEALAERHRQKKRQLEPEMSVNERFALFFHSDEGAVDPEETAFTLVGTENDLRDAAEEDHSRASATVNNRIDIDFVIKTAAYEWLKIRLGQCVNLTYSKPYISKDIGDWLQKNTSVKSRVSRQDIAKIRTANLSIDWNLRSFFRDRCFVADANPRAILPKLLTLTSDGTYIQAAECKKYLEQTWSSSPDFLFELLAEMITCDRVETDSGACNIRGSTHETTVQFEITGQLQTITEVAEQLTWLASTLRAPETLSYCIPVIRPGQYEKIINKKAVDGYQVTLCSIAFDLEPVDDGTYQDHCWNKLFPEYSVARGFPVSRRKIPMRGLEIPLDVMPSMIHARHIGKHKNSVFIHGFSSMFTLSKRLPGYALWHFSSTDDGSHISYLADRGHPSFRSLLCEELASDRHFVGWCEEYRYRAGAIDCKYDIDQPELDPASEECSLFEETVALGYRVTESETFVHRRHDQAQLSVFPSLDLRKIAMLSKKLVILWDVSDERGWLVNGTSALLHLIYASLADDRRSELFGPFLQFSFDQMQIAETHKETSAATILASEKNLSLKIDKHLGQSESFQQRVEDKLFILWHMILVQEKIPTPDLALSNTLEGWDFTELAEGNQTTMFSKMLPLGKDCCGWTTMIQDVSAVTLFSCNFGEIIQPIGHESCSRWKSLPKEECYLAVSLSDLKLVRRGNKPPRLSSRTTMPALSKHSGECRCPTSGDHDDLVRVLIPTSRLRMQVEISSAKHPQVLENGAVVFGEVTNRELMNDAILTTTKKRRRDSNTDNETSTSKGSKYRARRVTCRDYRVAIVCALDRELRAVKALMDLTSEEPIAPPEGDPYSYTYGKICGHRVVAACLPKDENGNLAAAHLGANLERSFPNVNICLLVGIGGGIPSAMHDIRLGDVVVGIARDDKPAILHYHHGKKVQDEPIRPIGCLTQPHLELTSIISQLASDTKSKTSLQNDLDEIARVTAEDDHDYSHPGVQHDELFESYVKHVTGRLSCDQCIGEVVPRSVRKKTHPEIHYGCIASGDLVIKDTVFREDIRDRFGALCLEMEAAGLSIRLPFLVIRGICDYADSHKQKDWQNYASAVAAAYAKLVLSRLKHEPECR